MTRRQWVYTRSGKSLEPLPDRPIPYRLPIAWYANKPAWMTHIPGDFLRFGNRFALESYLRRTR